MSYLLLFRHGLPLDLEECNITGSNFCVFCVCESYETVFGR